MLDGMRDLGFLFEELVAQSLLSASDIVSRR